MIKKLLLITKEALPKSDYSKALEFFTQQQKDLTEPSK